MFSIAKAHPGRIDWRVLEGGRDRVHEKPWQVFAYESPWNVVVRSRNDSGGGRRVCLALLDPAELGSRHAAIKSRQHGEAPADCRGLSPFVIGPVCGPLISDGLWVDHDRAGDGLRIRS